MPALKRTLSPFEGSAAAAEAGAAAEADAAAAAESGADDAKSSLSSSEGTIPASARQAVRVCTRAANGGFGAYQQKRWHNHSWARFKTNIPAKFRFESTATARRASARTRASDNRLTLEIIVK
jgi:hypothetical protein